MSEAGGQDMQGLELLVPVLGWCRQVVDGLLRHQAELRVDVRLLLLVGIRVPASQSVSGFSFLFFYLRRICPENGRQTKPSSATLWCIGPSQARPPSRQGPGGDNVAPLSSKLAIAA